MKLFKKTLSLSLVGLVLCLALGRAEERKAIKILILGDSLTEGYGIEKEEAYPAVLEDLLVKKGFTGSRVINAGISGSTSASAVSRLKWLLQSNPEILILALGANDGLRGVSPEATEKNLKRAVELAKGANVKVLLAGMKVPPNYGKDYSEKFESVFTSIASENGIPLIPFLLEGVAGKPEMNLPDGIHPNPQGHRRIAKTVLEYLEKIL